MVDPRQWPGFRDDLDAKWLEIKRGKVGRPPGKIKSDTGRAAVDRGDATYPAAVATREQSPSHKTRLAVREIGAKRERTPLKSPQGFIRERLAAGKTNGTLNHHLVAKALRFVKGGRQTFIAFIERSARNGDAEARDWWSVYSDLLPAQQSRVDFDDVCEAAGVPPDRIMAVAVSQAMRLGQDVGDFMAAVAHPEIVSATIQSARRIAGKHAQTAQKDRELLLDHAKFLPQRGAGISVAVNANAHAAAQAAAASQPSVPTFSESMQAPIDAQIVVQRQITDALEEA